MIKILSFIFLLTTSALTSVEYQPSSAKRRTLYMSLDPLNIPAHLSFYRLFPHSDEGKKALDDAIKLLSKGNSDKAIGKLTGDLHLPLIEELIEVVNRAPQKAPIQISIEELSWIDSISSHLKNRKLLGFRCQTLEEVYSLPSDQIDLGRALLLSQMGEEVDYQVLRSYEAVFDLMALQILARLNDLEPKKIITAMNQFIFDDMHFRFPPESLMIEDVDLYTFLPSVVDSRRGVCLGVSILYLCLAQRIGFDLTIITPPGHIFVRYDGDKTSINIETTARGVDMPDERYLSLENRELQRRSLKEVVGMAHVNHASTFWHNDENEKAIDAYEKALPFMPNDPLVKELLAYNYLIVGRIDEGSALLKELLNKEKEDPMESYRLAEDFLNGLIDVSGFKCIFDKTEKARSTLESKRVKIEDSLKKFPLFREGWLQLAVIFLQLDKHHEALKALEHFHKIDQSDAMVEYYLSALYLERLDFTQSWTHYKIAKSIVDQINYDPPQLKELRIELLRNYLGDAHVKDLH